MSLSKIEGRGENSPKNSRFEFLKPSSRRESALTSPDTQMERTHVRCYSVHGEGEQSTYLL